MLADLALLEAANNAGSLRQLGNWPPGPLFEHLGRAIECSFIGFTGFTFPLYLRVFAPLVKNIMLTRPFPTGFKLSKVSESKAWNTRAEFEPSLAFLRAQLARIAPADLPNPAMHQRHPSFGPLTPAEWVLYHLRHCELHLSFLSPVR